MAGAPVTGRAKLCPDRRAVELAVTDSGPGVPVSRREEIFGLFPRREHDAGAGLGRSLDLTAKEFEFLAYLARNVGKVCTRHMILESVWGPQYAGETHYLKVYAYRIRRKLHDEGGDFLQSDPSVGYRLVPPANGHHSLSPEESPRLARR
jgi:hypothetical protein